MKRIIACAALLVIVGSVVFGQVGEVRPGFIQSESDDVPVIYGGRTESPRRSNRPPQPVLLQKQYAEQVQERAQYMSAEELEVAIEQVRQENRQIRTRRAEEREAALKAAIEKMRANRQSPQ